MENNVATIPGKSDKEKLKREIPDQRKLNVSNWCKTTVCPWWQTKGFPWLKQLGDRICSAICNIHLPALNWGGVLVLVVLAYMARNGFLDDMPNIQWLVESTVNIIEWIFGLLRTILEWCVEVLEVKAFNWGVIEMFTEWVKEMFAL